MTRLHEGLPDKNYEDPGGRRTITYCLDSGLPATEYCSMDPRGGRTASGSIFPEDYPEGQICTFHTAESVITVCVDSPVLKEDGSATGLYHLAGEFCPEESKRQFCPPNFEREQVATAVADDDIWRYANVSSCGPCTVHTEAPVTDPDPNDPNNPVDPNAPYYPYDPTDPSEPNNPSNPTDPSNPTSPDEPWEEVNPWNPNPGGGSVFPNVPTLPSDPLRPSDGMAG